MSKIVPQVFDRLQQRKFLSRRFCKTKPLSGFANRTGIKVSSETFTTFKCLVDYVSCKREKPRQKFVSISLFEVFKNFFPKFLTAIVENYPLQLELIEDCFNGVPHR